MSHRADIGILRWAEGVFAAVSLFLLLSLPWPPAGTLLPVWLHFLGTTLVAAILVVKIRPDSRPGFFIALLLALYVVVNIAVSLPTTLAASSSVASTVLGLALATLQLIAGALSVVGLRRTGNSAHAI